VELDPDQGDAVDTVELNTDAWVAMQLALGGIADPTQAGGGVGDDTDDSEPPWLWDKRVPWRGVTLLAGPPKSGKSTLLRGLLRAGDEQSHGPGGGVVPFLGAGVRPFRALVVTEEMPSSWRTAPGSCRLLYLDGDAPKKAKAWEESLDHLRRLAWGYRCELIVVDSFAAVCAADENSARQIALAFAPLRSLSVLLPVLLVHHTTKYGTGSAAVRGSSAIAASCDAVLTLACAGADEDDPRRVLSAVGRLGRPHRLEYTMRPDGVLDLPAAKKRRTRSLLEGGA
jgi:RecA-family ATPase